MCARSRGKIESVTEGRWKSNETSLNKTGGNLQTHSDCLSTIEQASIIVTSWIALDYMKLWVLQAYKINRLQKSSVGKGIRIEMSKEARIGTTTGNIDEVNSNILGGTRYAKFIFV